MLDEEKHFSSDVPLSSPESSNDFLGVFSLLFGFLSGEVSFFRCSPPLDFDELIFVLAQCNAGI